jgi:hypothetical protein
LGDRADRGFAACFEYAQAAALEHRRVCGAVEEVAGLSPGSAYTCPACASSCAPTAASRVIG